MYIAVCRQVYSRGLCRHADQAAPPGSSACARDRVQHNATQHNIITRDLNHVAVLRTANNREISEFDLTGHSLLQFAPSAKNSHPFQLRCVKVRSQDAATWLPEKLEVNKSGESVLGAAVNWTSCNYCGRSAGTGCGSC